MREGPFQLGLVNDAICEAVPERTAFVQGDRRLTYGEFAARTHQLARVFLEHDITAPSDVESVEPWESAQEHVGVLSLNRPEFIEAYHGAFKARAVPFNINYRYTPAEVAGLLDDARAAAVVYEGRFGPVLADALVKVRNDPRLLVRIEDGSGEDPLPGSLDFETAIDEQPDTALDLPYSGREIYLVFTGGTTGFPKGVIWEHQELYLHTLTGQLPDEPRPTSLAEAAQRAIDNPGPTMMVCPPLMHGAGNWSSLICLNQGGTVVYSARPQTLDAHAILEACEREKVTMMGFTGDAFAIPLVHAMRERDYDLSSLFVLTTQAVALTPKVRGELHELLPDAIVIESYGTSEGGFQGLRIGTASDADRDEPSKFGAVNQTVIVSEDRTRIVDPSEVGTVGWIARSGRHQRGYLNDPDKTNESFAVVDGTRYLVSGDRASYREDGTIHFLGREAVCINTGGEKVFGEEVEAVLKAHPGVRDAIVLGTPDPRFGERVTAVYSAADDAVSEDELNAHCRDALAGYKVPRAWVRVDEVPRLENGKPDYVRAKQRALDAITEAV